METKFDLILHPVRMRIILAMQDKQLTPRELADILPDVAQATLYRHINTLADGGLLTVVEENPVRGTVEKVYALANPSIANAAPEDLQDFSKDDHLRFFTAFMTTILNDFARYVEKSETVDMVADGIGYHKAVLYLDDDELIEMSKAINEILVPLIKNKPRAGRKRRLLSTILMPDADATPDETESNET